MTSKEEEEERKAMQDRLRTKLEGADRDMKDKMQDSNVARPLPRRPNSQQHDQKSDPTVRGRGRN